MKCPKCKHTDLAPTRLESDLPAMGCAACEGALLSLLYYRDWAERTQEPGEVDVAALTLAEECDTKVAMTCPKCARLMTKYRISGGQSNRLDLCASCDEAWIDGGEWGMLKALELATSLPAVFTDGWQQRLRKEASDQQKLERLQRLVGDDDAAQAHEVKRWLQSSAHRATLLRYLSTD